MCFDAARVFFIKDLKRHLLTLEIARDRPSRYGEKKKTVRVTVGRGPVPCYGEKDGHRKEQTTPARR